MNCSLRALFKKIYRERWVAFHIKAPNVFYGHGMIFISSGNKLALFMLEIR